MSWSFSSHVPNLAQIDWSRGECYDMTTVRATPNLILLPGSLPTATAYGGTRVQSGSRTNLPLSHQHLLQVGRSVSTLWGDPVLNKRGQAWTVSRPCVPRLHLLCQDTYSVVDGVVFRKHRRDTFLRPIKKTTIEYQTHQTSFSVFVHLSSRSTNEVSPSVVRHDFSQDRNHRFSSRNGKWLTNYTLCKVESFWVKGT